MAEDKRKGNVKGDSSVDSELDDQLRGSSSSRARNRTVMLTPDVTGKVRSLLHSEQEQSSSADPLADVLPPLSGKPGGSKSNRIDYGGDLTAEQERNQGEFASGGLLRSAQQTVFLERGSLSSSPNANQGSGLSGIKQAGSGTGELNPLSHLIQPQGRHPSQQPSSTGGTSSINVSVRPSSTANTKIVGFLISFDSNPNGDVYEIREGRWLLTSKPTNHGEYILIEDESISPLHAIIKASSDGKLQVLDQLSEFGTAVTPSGAKKEQEVSGTMVSIGHADIIRFGKRNFMVCLVPSL
jgi:hypothetical protein